MRFVSAGEGAWVKLEALCTRGPDPFRKGKFEAKVVAPVALLCVGILLFVVQGGCEPRAENVRVPVWPLPRWLGFETRLVGARCCFRCSAPINFDDFRGSNDTPFLRFDIPQTIPGCFESLPPVWRVGACNCFRFPPIGPASGETWFSFGLPVPPPPSSRLARIAFGARIRRGPFVEGRIVRRTF